MARYIAAIALALGAFVLAIVSGYQQAREMARTVEEGGSTWNGGSEG